MNDLVAIEQHLTDETRAEIERLASLSTKVKLGAVRLPAVWTPWHGDSSGAGGKKE
jgi:hypothetical protein